MAADIVYFLSDITVHGRAQVRAGQACNSDLGHALPSSLLCQGSAVRSSFSFSLVFLALGRPLEKRPSWVFVVIVGKRFGLTLISLSLSPPLLSLSLARAHTYARSPVLHLSLTRI